jgi:Amt family ammonium transporter
MREILRSQLRGWGLDAATASTSDEAMKMLIDAAKAARPYDVAILDSDLANTNTLDFGKAIKARLEITKTVLLILLPVNGDLAPSKLRMAGFSGHLIKPVRQSRLYDAIVSAMVPTPESDRVVAIALPSTSGPATDRAVATPHAQILIAEDNRVNQIVASEVLAKHGYVCEIVENGRKAVTAALGGVYDLILMDCSMPEMDGFEATRLIRQAEADPTKAPRHTPIIALTANAINGDRERCLEAGMDEYVSKPIDPNRLIKAIRTLLANSKETSRKQPASEPPATAPAIPYEEAPPIAIDALLDRCMGDVGTVALIINEFERQAVENVEEIARHMGTGDGKETARVAHALKGASGILSASKLSDIAFKLERMGRSGAPTGADQLLTQLNDEVKRCIDYLPIARAAIAKRAKV